MGSSASQNKTSGILYVVKINTGTEAAPAFTTISSQQSAKFDFKNKAIDVTGQDDAGWDACISGQGSWGITLAALTILTDAGWTAVQTAVLARNAVQVEFTKADGTAYYGWAVITALGLDGAFDKAAASSITFQGDQALSTVPNF